MALEDLNPAVRVEEILDGADIEPATRLEYFMKKAANEVPKPAGSSDAGKVVLVNEAGDGYELGEIPSGLPEYTSADDGKALSIEAPKYVVLPAQSITFTDGYGTAVGVDFSHLEVGDEITVVGSAFGQTVSLDGEVIMSDGHKQIVAGNDYFNPDGSCYIEEISTVTSITMDIDEYAVFGDSAAGWNKIVLFLVDGVTTKDEFLAAYSRNIPIYTVYYPSDVKTYVYLESYNASDDEITVNPAPGASNYHFIFDNGIFKIEYRVS